VLIGGLWFKDSPDKKFVRLYLQDKPDVVSGSCLNPSYMRSKAGRSQSEASPKQKCETLSEK
jgi:hypothetical protein